MQMLFVWKQLLSYTHDTALEDNINT
jgi:hypothetical protein